MGCVTPEPESLEVAPYVPDKLDYVSFREAYKDLLEPNYLPFMVHQIAENTASGDRLLFCRWPDDQMPIDVYIEPPEIPDELQDEFNEIEPKSYVDGAVAALATWEASLDGLVRFRRVSEPGQAELTIHLLGRSGQAELLLEDPALDSRLAGVLDGVSSIDESARRIADIVDESPALDERLYEIVERITKLGAAVCLKKPFTPDNLRRALALVGVEAG